jgi:hypothetical protein
MIRTEPSLVNKCFNKFPRFLHENKIRLQSLLQLIQLSNLLNSLNVSDSSVHTLH